MNRRIAFVSGQMPPIALGGVQRYILNLVREFHANDDASVIICRHYRNLAKIEKTSHATIYRMGWNPVSFSKRRVFNTISRVIGNISRLLELPQYALATDIVHSHVGEISDVCLGNYLASKAECCHVTTIHGRFGRAAEDLTMSRSFFKQLSHADAIIANRKHSKEYLLKRGLKQTYLLENPIPVEDYLRPSSFPRESKPNTVNVLFLGRLTRRRGAHLAIEAFAEAARTAKELKIWFVGDGALRGYIQRYSENTGIAERVNLVGVKDDVRKYLWRSDIYLAPSPIANSPSLALREAMSAGLAIVATDVEETSEVVRPERTGRVVPPDSTSIADAISALAENRDLREQLSRNAIEFAKSKFDIDSHIKKLYAIYKGVCS